MSDIMARIVEATSVRCWSLDMSKSKNLPKYRKDSPILTQGTRTPLISSLGRYWIALVVLFLIQNVQHLSTLITILDHWHQIANRFTRCWFSDSWELMTAASSANWNQWRGLSSLKEKPNWRYFSDLICCIKVLKHKLKSKGLKQSPWRTPRPIDMKGVRKSGVMIEVLNSVYKLLISCLMWSGTWW